MILEADVTEQIQEQNLNDIGVEITLAKPDDFLVIVETLSRIGIASKKTKTLFQTCHILHKRGSYRIVHFLEMFKLDGKLSTIADEDYVRRDTIAKLLAQWKLCKIVNQDGVVTQSASDIKIVPFREKRDWLFVQKYRIGGRKDRVNQTPGV